MKPRLLDLFCGAGGCSVGYARAGFDVVGVDIEPHPDYPYEFLEADALWVLQLGTWMGEFDVIHASPPCPRYSVATVARGTPSSHPDLIGPVRGLLAEWVCHGGVYVIENVPGAPMPGAVMICGAAMGLESLARHRMFESNAPLMSPGCACDSRGTVSVFGHSGEDRRDGANIKHVPLDEIKRLMGIDWMTRREDVSDAIPPVYTEYLGQQLVDYLARVA